MRKKSLSKKKYGVKDIVIIVGGLALTIIVAVIIVSRISSPLVLAREAKYISYVSQMRKIVERANALSAFNKIKYTNWVCLGTYNGQQNDFCWGNDNNGIVNNLEVDRALSEVESIPRGQFSPYQDFHYRGTAFKLNYNSIEMKVYVGDHTRTKVVCGKLNMSVDSDDDLSCVLITPIVKN